VNRRSEIEAFVRERSSGLEASLSRYLADEASESAVQATIDGIFAQWEQSGLSVEPTITCETPLWWAVWGAQHLCSPSHPLSEFRPRVAEIVAVLRGGQPLPSGSTGLRP
jgi:hypothetical protein